MKSVVLFGRVPSSLPLRWEVVLWFCFLPVSRALRADRRPLFRDLTPLPPPQPLSLRMDHGPSSPVRRECQRHKLLAFSAFLTTALFFLRSPDFFLPFRPSTSANPPTRRGMRCCESPRNSLADKQRTLCTPQTLHVTVADGPQPLHLDQDVSQCVARNLVTLQAAVDY